MAEENIDLPAGRWGGGGGKRITVKPEMKWEEDVERVMKQKNLTL
jgi:hypothetical protein